MGEKIEAGFWSAAGFFAFVFLLLLPLSMLTLDGQVIGFVFAAGVIYIVVLCSCIVLSWFWSKLFG